MINGSYPLLVINILHDFMLDNRISLTKKKLFKVFVKRDHFVFKHIEWTAIKICIHGKSFYSVIASQRPKNEPDDCSVSRYVR